MNITQKQLSAGGKKGSATRAKQFKETRHALLVELSKYITNKIELDAIQYRRSNEWIAAFILELSQK